MEKAMNEVKNEDKNEVEILLVEDNPTDAELCIRALKKNNLTNRLAWVKDGAEALDFLFSTGAYSGRRLIGGLKVVLLDLRLPKVDGMEVLRRVKEDRRTRAIPVVVLSSSQEDCDVAESYRLGVNSYISKPVVFDAFVRTISELGLYWLVVNRPGSKAETACR
jgi:CheY-like chemotaxis protein